MSAGESTIRVLVVLIAAMICASILYLLMQPKYMPAEKVDNAVEEMVEGATDAAKELGEPSL